ncbi:translation initiation factor IF-3 [Planctomicrobium sp. SH527]|uniref:translation initiation factor IF-3 n=1 Tax=Planctomicrobium sp. SH527 TaxID=3448123 RepID=UPI003F5B2B0A
MNERIRISPVRVVNAEGEMLGVIETAAALQMAQDVGLDLVEVSPDSKPPVCRIMDFGKAQYEKHRKSAGPKQHKSQLKQIRLGPKTGQHDIHVKVEKAREFLSRKDKVKVNVVFRGRENAHHDRGRDLLQEIINQLGDAAVIEQPPRMEGARAMSMLLMPSSKTIAAAKSLSAAKPNQKPSAEVDDNDDIDDVDDDSADDTSDDSTDE